jgi:hypothetical protein
LYQFSVVELFHDSQATKWRFDKACILHTAIIFCPNAFNLSKNVNYNDRQTRPILGPVWPSRYYLRKTFTVIVKLSHGKRSEITVSIFLQRCYKNAFKNETINPQKRRN